MSTSVAPSQAFLDGAKDIDQPERYRLIGKLLEKCPSVLDVGCGDGLLRPHLGSDYMGIDTDEVAIAKAKRYWPGGVFMQANAETFVYAGGFHGVVLNEVLYYFADPHAALVRYADMLFRGGRMVVSIRDRGAPFWQRCPNRRALKIARRFAKGHSHKEHTVEQHGKKWTVLVIHC